MESGYKVKDIVLIENNFKRVHDISFDENTKTDLKISVSVEVLGSNIHVAEKVIYKHTFDNRDEVFCNVEMIGIFEKIGNSEITDLDKFGKFNGAAIIFPFIRELISNNCLKGGIGVVLLPPVNFYELNSEE